MKGQGIRAEEGALGREGDSDSRVVSVRERREVRVERAVGRS